MSFFSGIKSICTFPRCHYNAGKEALKVGKAKYRELGPPNPIGLKFFEHPNLKKINESISSDVFSMIVWHCTNLHAYEMKNKQIPSGQLDKRGDIYYSTMNDPHLAVHYGKRDSIIEKDKFEPILLKLAYHGPGVKNECFNTFFIPSSREEPVYILEAFKVDPKYLEYVSNPNARPAFKDILLDTASAAYQAYFKALEPCVKPSRDNDTEKLD